MAFDSSGNLYVANAGNNTVSKFAPGATSPNATLTGLNYPVGLAFDASGNLYVTNNSGNSVSRFAPGSTSPSATLTGLNHPNALAFDGSGNLYVANSGGFSVSKFAPGATTPSATLTPPGGPYDLVFDGSGNLYVSTGGTVSKFTPGSTTPSATLTDDLSAGEAMAVDGHSDLFVADDINSWVVEFPPGSTTHSTTLSGLFAALAFDGSGNLYASSYGSTVSKFAPGATTASATLTVPVEPYSLTFDGSGNLYVVNGSGTVSKFTAASTTPVAGGVVIRSSLPTRPMSLGGTNNAVAGVNLTDAELAQIKPLPTLSGTVTVGDSSQTGDITFSTVTLGGENIQVVQSATGPGKIVLDDGGGAATALNGNAGNITLQAGSGGILAASANNSTAEIATSGTAYLYTSGPVGTSSNRIQFGGNTIVAVDNIDTNWSQFLGSPTAPRLGIPGRARKLGARAYLLGRCYRRHGPNEPDGGRYRRKRWIRFESGSGCQGGRQRR